MARIYCSRRLAPSAGRLHTTTMVMAVSSDTPDDSAARYRRIYAIVAGIPHGRVATYGQVAGEAGLPRCARLVGRALAVCPPQLPWHRVVNAAGRSALPPGSDAYAEQLRRLAAEGVELHDGRVALRGHRWQPASLDELLWGPEPAGTGRRRCAGS